MNVAWVNAEVAAAVAPLSTAGRHVTAQGLDENLRHRIGTVPATGIYSSHSALTKIYVPAQHSAMTKIYVPAQCVDENLRPRTVR